jgi:hypothetical protein
VGVWRGSGGGQEGVHKGSGGAQEGFRRGSRGVQEWLWRASGGRLEGVTRGSGGGQKVVQRRSAGGPLCRTTFYTKRAFKVLPANNVRSRVAILSSSDSITVPVTLLNMLNNNK